MCIKGFYDTGQTESPEMGTRWQFRPVFLLKSWKIGKWTKTTLRQ